MKVGSLFSGIGGFDLAARWMGWRTVWYSEIDPFCNRVMAHHFPEATALGDITRIDWSTVEPVDLLCGGFPCQPHSVAGARRASDDERDLWSEFARAIRGLRPRYVVAENVPGLFTSESGRFFNRVLSDLAALGYDAEWQVLSAADMGAPHLRERLWIVANPRGGRCGQPKSGQDQQSGRTETERPSPAMADAPSHRWDPRWTGDVAQESGGGQPDRSRLGTHVPDPDDPGRREQWRGEPTETGHPTPQCRDWWRTEPAVGRVAHGVPHRVAQLRGLGNAIVPACAYHIFQRLTP